MMAIRSNKDVKAPDTLSVRELDAIIRSMSLDDDTRQSFPPPKKWKRVDVGETECYVGDELCVVSLIEKQPETMAELTENQCNTEDTIIKYLQSEGWIGKEYIYVGLQRFNLNKPPEGFAEDENGTSA